MKNTIPISEARAQLPQLVKQVDEQFARFDISVSSKDKATLISPEEIEAYEATIAILSDTDLVRALQQAELDYQAGNTHTFDEVFS